MAEMLERVHTHTQGDLINKNMGCISCNSKDNVYKTDQLII